LVGGLKRLAQSRRLQMDHVEAVVQGELNDSLAAIGVIGAKGHPGLERIQVKVYVSSGESEIELEGLWREVLASSPLFRTFQTSAKVEVGLQLVS
jgi:hypothetical protein